MSKTRIRKQSRQQNQILETFADFAFDCPEISLVILFDSVAYYSFAKLLCYSRG